MIREREAETNLPIFRFKKEEDLADLEKLTLFWSNDLCHRDNQVLLRVGSDKVFYLGSSIPIPESLGNHCPSCGGWVSENREVEKQRGDKTLVSISRICRGSCGSVISAADIEVLTSMTRECLLFVRFPQG